MFQDIANFFNSENFDPHGHCFAWNPTILWLHVISDAAVASAYYSIPFALIYFASKRQDLPFKNIFWLFGAFILLCGTTHIMAIWTLWHPDYALEGVVKALTAIVSIGTFFAMITIIPFALQMASPEQLAKLNAELQQNIKERDTAQAALQASYGQMEKTVQERTAALLISNRDLQEEIHERKKSQLQLNAVLEELTRSNSELQRFAYICSHDLQEPARMVSSYASILQKKLGDTINEDEKKCLHFLTDGAERMQAMIKSILAYARSDNKDTPLVEINCNKIVEDVLHDLQGAIKESGAKITRDPLPTLWGDPIQYTQIFQNLIANALKFHKKGEPPDIAIGATHKDKAWHFFVRDNGIGINPQYMEKIFFIFQRLNRKEDYPGTGIGLAICKKIIERYGGRITVESSENNGSTFSFTIPDRA